jgi:hypothetical protein
MGGQVDPHCLDVRPAAGEIFGCRGQFAVLGSDDDIETVGGELTASSRPIPLDAPVTTASGLESVTIFSPRPSVLVAVRSVQRWLPCYPATPGQTGLSVGFPSFSAKGTR